MSHYLSLFMFFCREINKALCGFLNFSKSWQHQNIFIDEGDKEIQLARNDRDSGLLRTETTEVGIFVQTFSTPFIICSQFEFSF